MFVKTLKSNYKVFKTSGRQVGNGLLLKLNDELIKRKTEHEITSVIIDENFQWCFIHFRSPKS